MQRYEKPLFAFMPPRHLFLPVLAAFLATHLPLAAGEHFVSSQGDDHAEGTQARPWKTLRHGCAQLKAGDTLVVMPGVYHEKIVIEASGSQKEGFVILRGEPGAVISGSGAEGRNLILIENRSYVRIQGFELCDNKGVRDGSAIRVTGAGSHIELRDNRIHDIRGRDAMGITVYGTSTTEPLQDIVIDGNEIYNCEPARSEALTLNGNVTGFKVTNNRVHDVNNIGIDFIGGEVSICRDRGLVARSGLCKGNKLWRCRSNYDDGYAAGIYVDGGRTLSSKTM